MKKTGKTFSSQELKERLMFTQDLMDRLQGCPFFPLKDTCKGIRGGKEILEQRGEITEELNGDGIYIGIKKNEWTEQRLSMLKTLEPFLHYQVIEGDNGFVVKDKDDKKPPIIATVIKRNYKFFKNADITFWGVTEFLMPNPFDDYWKARYLVK